MDLIPIFVFTAIVIIAKIIISISPKARKLNNKLNARRRKSNHYHCRMDYDTDGPMGDTIMDPANSSYNGNIFHDD